MSYQRSFRFDDEIQTHFEGLPEGTANNLANQFFWRFFTDPDFRKEFELHDRRKDAVPPPKVLPGQTKIEDIMGGN